jgi:hypothetical protein
MKKLFTIITIASLILTGCKSTPDKPLDDISTNRTSASGDLNKWINGELTKYLDKNLGDVPKFKNEPILLVSMKNEQISSNINGLTSDIRSQLMDNLLVNQNITLVRRQLDYQNQHHRSLTNVSCDTETNIRYFIGLEVDKSAVSGNYTIRLRAMEADNPDQWVQGISSKWTGQLDARQESALAKEEKDPYLQGLRSRPFGSGESDLLAQYLSHNLSCLLASANLPEIKLYTKPVEKINSDITTAVRLVDNYLSRFQEVSQTNNIETANAVMKYEFLNIDSRKNLSLLNLSINFIDNGERAQGIDTQAYIKLPKSNSRTSDRNNSGQEEQAPKANLISAFNFILPKRASSCDANNPWQNGESLSKAEILSQDDCFAVEYSSKGRNNYLVYENTNGQFYVMNDQCISKDNRRGSTRYPSMKGDPSAIYLDDSRGFENFYLLSFNSSPRKSGLANYLNDLPSLCGNNGRSMRKSQFLKAIKDYMRTHLGQLDWQKISIDHR